ncbi:hypothetical protein [Halalkalibacter urbisdiaboli]|uniref:hypothetical protein n=1 Tax=Halalkalibacter urbisdiaboli TaxID=1960589 RepID=UPI0013FD9D38|nr:hypothetical protein [Halalkalibacter urbisdiaboli]
MAKKDQLHQGREDYFVDEERMLDDGLSGGTVSNDQAGKIEEARPFKKETPPNK